MGVPQFRWIRLPSVNYHDGTYHYSCLKSSSSGNPNQRYLRLVVAIKLRRTIELNRESATNLHSSERPSQLRTTQTDSDRFNRFRRLAWRCWVYIMDLSGQTCLMASHSWCELVKLIAFSGRSIQSVPLGNPLSVQTHKLHARAAGCTAVF